MYQNQKGIKAFSFSLPLSFSDFNRYAKLRSTADGNIQRSILYVNSISTAKGER